VLRLFATQVALCVVFVGVVHSDDGSVPRDAGAPSDASTQPDAAPSPPRFEGRYTLLDPEPTMARAREATTGAVRGLNPGIRDVFARQLATLMEVYRAITIELRSADGIVRVRLDDRTLESPGDGSPRAQSGPEGRRVSVVHRLEGAALVEEEQTRNGTRRNTFTFEDADVLVVTTSFRTPLLPRPVEIVARYRRASP
jgi:hypothetical protein